MDAETALWYHAFQYAKTRMTSLTYQCTLLSGMAIISMPMAILSDWVSHLWTVFPEVRLKRHLEMRGADAGGSSARVAALSALWAAERYLDTRGQSFWPSDQSASYR